MNRVTRLSLLTAGDVAEYCRIDEADGCDIRTLETMLAAAKAYIRSFTGLDDEQADAHADLVVAALVLCQDMYDNRTMYVESENVNRVVEAILGLHSINLL